MAEVVFFALTAACMRAAAAAVMANEVVQVYGELYFRCDRCGDSFERDRSEAEAAEEYRAVWGADPVEGEVSTVCEDCFLALTGLGAAADAEGA